MIEQDAFSAVEAQGFRLLHRRSVDTVPGFGLRGEGSLVYLATPFTRRATGVDGGFCATRAGVAFHDARVWSGWLAARGITAISPIVQAMAGMTGMTGGHGSYSIAGGIETLRAAPLDPLDEQFWTRWCKPLLDACDCVVIPPIHGWRDSAGVAHEARAMLESNGFVYVLEHGVAR